jgi:N-acetylglucosaminyldiphosphoundecaprenol N-acetyl-beta-D-mannosaminyltransferase
MRKPEGRLFGMPVDFVSSDQALSILFELAVSGDAALVVTPNVDHFLRWQRNDKFRSVYESASLSLLDGQPLVWLATLGGATSATRVTGVDLVTRAIARASEENVPVALIGGAPDVVARAALNLVSSYPNTRVILAESPRSEDLEDPEYVSRIANVLAAHPTKIVALCLGSPKQEAFFEKLAPLSNGGVYMGVGAAVDFLAGNVRRAPLCMQKSGTEWLFRLANEPRRLWRRYLIDDIGIALYFAKLLIHRNVKYVATQAASVDRLRDKKSRAEESI